MEGDSATGNTDVGSNTVLHDFDYSSPEIITDEFSIAKAMMNTRSGWH